MDPECPQESINSLYSISIVMIVKLYNGILNMVLYCGEMFLKKVTHLV